MRPERHHRWLRGGGGRSRRRRPRATTLASSWTGRLRRSERGPRRVRALAPLARYAGLAKRWGTFEAPARCARELGRELGERAGAGPRAARLAMSHSEKRAEWWREGAISLCTGVVYGATNAFVGRPPTPALPAKAMAVVEATPVAKAQGQVRG